MVSGCALVGTSGNSTGGESDGGAPLLYLQEEIPACRALVGSDKDPCAVRGAPNLLSLSSIEFAEIPNYWDLYYMPGYPPYPSITHLVVRATFLPETTRCSQYEREFADFIPFDALDSELLMCFVDAQVNEYVVGIGPPTLTLEAYSLVVGRGSVLNLERFRAETAEAFEGREGVMFIGPSSTTVLEAWSMLEFWDVQRKGDKVVVAAPYKDYFEIWKSRFSSEELALLEVPLSDFEGSSDFSGE